MINTDKDKTTDEITKQESSNKLSDEPIIDNKKRSFSAMNNSIKANKIIVSKLTIPTSIGDIYNNTDDGEVLQKKKKYSFQAHNNMDSFYKENVEELNELISELQVWESNYFELSTRYQSMERKLNNELNPEIEIQKNLVKERKRYYDELKQDNDAQVESFDKKLNLMKETKETEKLGLVQENNLKAKATEEDYAKERNESEQKLEEDKKKLMGEISVLKREQQENLLKLESKEELQAAKIQMGYDMNALKSKSLIKLHQEAEKLESINKDLSKEIDSINTNNQKKLIPIGVELNSQIESETLSLNSIIKLRVKKIEESAVVAEQYEQMQMKYNDLQAKITLYNQKLQNATKSVGNYKAELREKEMQRRGLHNELQDLRGNIRVFCRIKPENNLEFIMKEINKVSPDDSINDEETLSKFEKSQLEVIPPDNFRDSFLSSPRKSTKAGNGGSIFTFDKIFDESASNKDVFDEVSQLVQSSLDGYKVCIFAYGQTGSGKTFTMLHPQDGIIPSTLNHIYSWIDNLKPLGWEYSIKIQFVEIYNESINDLLAEKATQKPKKKIEIRHTDGRTSLTNVENIDITHSDNAEQILRNAMKARATAATKENDHSSRSHSIFTITLTGHNSTTSKSCEGILNLIDLAGCERLNKSQATGDRLKETQAINKSLSCLGDVIHSLRNSKNLKASHIPFRNSKLTYMLQNYLTGDGKTLMFVNVSSKSYVETVNSLRFSSKVNNTKMR